MFPLSFHAVDRVLVGPLALYAPRKIGSVHVWRGFPHEPWSPDIDLVVATGLVGTLTDGNSIAERYLIDDDHRFFARRACRGVRLSEVLAASERAVPPVELAARVALALLRPGPRVAHVVGPSQIVISFDGDVHVDGFDPEARIEPWAPAHVHGPVDGAIIAACAAGVALWRDARAAVERRASSACMQLIRALDDGDRDRCLLELAALPSSRAVVAGLVRSLFPERAAAVDETREELALLDRRVLPAWPHTAVVHPPLAPRPATFSALRNDAVNETIRVRNEAAALDAEMRAETNAVVALVLAHPTRSWWTRFADDLRAFFAPMAARVYAAAPLRRRRP